MNSRWNRRKLSRVVCGGWMLVTLWAMSGCADAGSALVGVAEAGEESQADEEDDEALGFRERIQRAIDEGNYAEGSVAGKIVAADIRVAENEILRLTEMVNTYYVINEELPEDLEDLKDADLLDESREDPWGNEFIYEVEGPTDFEIFSKGPDGEKGTERDVRRE